MNENSTTIEKRKAGRPVGSSYKQMVWNNIIAPHGEEIAKKVLEMALEGNEGMLKVLADRLFPRPQDMVVSYELPKNMTEKDLFDLGEQIIRLVGTQDILPDQAQILMSTVKMHRDGMVLKNLSDQLNEITKKVENINK